MKLLALLLGLVALVGGCSGCASIPTTGDLRATTLRLEFAQNGGMCSGTAIGPSSLLTASHCFSGNDLARVNGQSVKVKFIIRRGQDNAFVYLDKPMFKIWAKFGPPLRQGDRVRWWGNPMGEADIYRQGYVSRAWADGMIVDATICRGDSGAGIFNDAGQIVGVVTAMSDLSGCTFMLSFPMVRA